MSIVSWVGKLASIMLNESPNACIHLLFMLVGESSLCGNAVKIDCDSLWRLEVMKSMAVRWMLLV